jgi:hypothetical protein
MKVRPLLENIVKFPTKERKKQVSKDRQEGIDEITGLPLEEPKEKFFVVNKDFQAVGQYDTKEEAKINLAKYTLKTGDRKASIKSWY